MGGGGGGRGEGGRCMRRGVYSGWEGEGENGGSFSNALCILKPFVWNLLYIYLGMCLHTGTD